MARTSNALSVEGAKKIEPVEGLRFTVASRLFEELGDRLVGSPAMALAELVKNAYDADAYTVTLHLRPGGLDEIHVVDDGHGMTLEQFKRFWLRVGDDHKEKEGSSPLLGRIYTGSKGVGRIAAELLSQKLEIRTTSTKDRKQELRVSLDWNQAINTGDLVDVELGAEILEFTEIQPHGTTLILQGLRHSWPSDDVADLSHELWRLEPPFRKRRIMASHAPPLPGKHLEKIAAEERYKYRDPSDFGIVFKADDQTIVDKFEEIRLLLLTLHSARIVGKIEKGHPTVVIQFNDEEKYQTDLTSLAGHGSACVDAVRFEIRVFELKGRQPGNLPVGELRDYLRKYGGVQIFDGGFRLSHYGSRENDWLLITEDHARRLSESSLLPAELQEPLGMHFMPTYYKVYGAVEINTNKEENLSISITRDRLINSPAFDHMRNIVRASLHWYGMLRMAREHGTRQIEDRPRLSVSSVSSILREYKDEIPRPIYNTIKKATTKADRDIAEEERSTSRKLAILSSYATAGIASMAYHHEVDKQLFNLEKIAESLDELEGADIKKIAEIKSKIGEWTQRARQLKAMFSPLASEQNRTEEQRYLVRKIVSDTNEQLQIPLGPVQVQADIDPQLRFPSATYMEWTSILQNVIFNAINALDGSEKPRIQIKSLVDGHLGQIRVQDNGSGIDIEKSEQYFEPFSRSGTIDPIRIMHGFGGAGMGLSIVRMIAQRRGCKVRFGQPDHPYTSCFIMEWNVKS